ncbi:MAG: hypothetical protein WCL25_01670 [bacterium]
MKRAILLIAGLGVFLALTFSNTSLSLAQEKDPAAARKLAEERARVTLGVKEWNIEAKSTDSASKAKPWSDMLNLADGKLSSKYMTEKGFTSSNITVTVNEGVIVWETMQRSSKGEIAFWRGELAGPTMNGVVSIKPEKGETEEFSFVSIVPPPPKPEAPAKAVEPTKTKVTEPAKKDKK